jgi:hypothetical protein
MTRFDDKFPGLLESEEETPRTSSVNPFEIALWVLGVLLLSGGIMSLQWVAARSGQVGIPGGDGFILSQMIYSLGPAAVTAGLFAIIVSLALRAALSVIARRASALARRSDTAEDTESKSAEPAPSASVAERTPQLDPLQFAPPQLRSRRREVDHSAYRRPPSE